MVEGFATSCVSDNAQFPLMFGHKIRKVRTVSDLQIRYFFVLARKRGFAILL